MFDQSNPSNDDRRPLWVRAGRLSLALAGLCALVAGADIALGLYDVVLNPATKLGGITAPLRRLHAGVNTFTWSERIRTTGIAFSIVGQHLAQQDVDKLSKGIAGSLHVSEGTADGTAPPRWEYGFTLAMEPPVKLPSVERLMAATGGPLPDEMSMGVRYDVDCGLAPVADSRTTADELHAADIHADQTLHFAIVLQGDVPDSLDLVMTYSRTPRSFLHGTLLGRVCSRLIGR